jgi:hypothetical protein
VLITIVVMIVIVPVVSVMPEMLMFTPPYLAFSPATLARFVEFMTPVVCLSAVVAMMLNCLVKLVLRVDRAPIAAVIGCGPRHGG